MQESCNSCFGSKIRNMTLRQAKNRKAQLPKYNSNVLLHVFLHSCQPVFHLTKCRVTYFSPETIVESFLHFIVLLIKVLFNLIRKRQFVVIQCHITLTYDEDWYSKDHQSTSGNLLPFLLHFPLKEYYGIYSKLQEWTII